MKGLELKKQRVIDAGGAVLAEAVASSGNVFADLGLPDAAQLKLKADLMIQVALAINARGLTQAAAARSLGVSQGNVSDVMNGRHKTVSIEALFKMLNNLGRDVEVRVAEPAAGAPGMRVVGSVGKPVVRRPGRPAKVRAVVAAK